MILGLKNSLPPHLPIHPHCRGPETKWKIPEQPPAFRPTLLKKNET
jgi:hypothetical protein